ncbi:MAG TPA: carboxypeptidase regulatory-like domain-containing protein [Acidobacteriota bacterium]|nr:carboxypeptidase regulatory-like domain-containing protein [Acidobacteriota bacterium]
MKEGKVCYGALFVFLLSVIAIHGLWVLPANAQSAGTGSLTGIIKDPSGAIIEKAEVTATNIATGQSRTALSGLDGSYRFTLLPPGKYKVKVSASGFQTAEFPSVTVNVTETAVLNCALTIGTQNQTMTVEANAEAIQTTTSTMGTLVSSEDVVALPLTSRNYTQILDLSTGVSASVHDATQLGKGTQYTSVNGSNPSQNNYQMDGVAINSLAGLGTAGDQNVGAGIGIPNPDAIQEFKVQTSTFDASYGRNPGGNVNVVTKSGSNELHGSAFEFLRNTVLNANPFFYNRDKTETDPDKPVLNQNQFGFTVGGPVVKDRFFLFGTYQGTRQKNGISGKGIYSATLPPIPDGDRTAPGFAAAFGAANCGFPNFPWFGGANLACNGSNLNPVALKILQLKLPNGSYYFPGSGTSGYRTVAFTDPARYSGDQFIINSDLMITRNETLQTRFFYTRDPQYSQLDGHLPGNPETDFYSNHNLVVKLNSIITNRFTNEVRFSYQRNWGDISDKPLAGSSPAELGINHVVPDQDEAPWFLISGGPSLFNDFRPAQSLAGHYQYADQIAWVHNQHTVRAGFEYERIHYFSNPGFSRGFFIFFSMNDFFVGGPGNIGYSMMEKGTGPKGGIDHQYRMNNLSSFVQDDWKLSSRVTVNLGMRWEFDGALKDELGNLTNLWPSLIASVPVPPTEPTTSGLGLLGYVVPQNYDFGKYGPLPRGVYQADNDNSLAGHAPYSNFAPRIGIAWQPTKKGNLVVRAGFGLFYDRIWADSFVHALQQSPPYAVSLDYSGPNNHTLQDPFRDLPLGTYPSRWSNLACLPDGTGCTGGGSDLSANFLPMYLHTPLTRQYNVGIQYEFAPRWVLEVGYVGTSGINLLDVYHNNNLATLASSSHPINGQIANTTGNVGLRVPYIGFQPSGLSGTETDGRSNYNSMQLAIRKEFSYGLTLQGSYTWSKNLSTVGTGGPYFTRNSNDPYNSKQQYGPTEYNRPQRFILNYQYALPFGTHKGAAGKLLEGWSVVGITTAQGGTPLTFWDNANGSIYGAAQGVYVVSRAQMCSGMTHGDIFTSGDIHHRLGGNSGGAGYINQSAFCAAPTIGNGSDFGNSGVGIALGPGQFNWDATFIKDTKIREGHTIQFRTEFYNVFNHTQFGNPDTTRSSPTFGQIAATTVNPRIIQFGLKYMF